MVKRYVPITFSPPGLNGIITFWCQLKAHIFLSITPKFQLQIHYTLAVVAENLSISGIPTLIFLCIFITALFPVSHSYICPRRENKKQPWGKLYKMFFRGKGWSVKEWKYTCQNGHIPFKLSTTSVMDVWTKNRGCRNQYVSITFFVDCALLSINDVDCK